MRDYAQLSGLSIPLADVSSVIGLQTTLTLMNIQTEHQVGLHHQFLNSVCHFSSLNMVGHILSSMNTLSDSLLDS